MNSTMEDESKSLQQTFVVRLKNFTIPIQATQAEVSELTVRCS